MLARDRMQGVLLKVPWEEENQISSEERALCFQFK